MSKNIEEKKTETVQEKMDKVKKHFGTFFYKPFNWQKRALEVVRKKNTTALISANKLGKTGTGANIVISWALGYEPWNVVDKDHPEALEVGGQYYRKSSLGIKPPVNIIITGEDWKLHIGRTLVPELKKWAPAGWYETKKNEQGVDFLWTWNNGSTFTIMCYTQDDDLFESFRAQGCIEENQKVLMSDGSWKKIKDINIGDMVWTVNDKNGSKRQIKTVVNHIPRGEKEIIQISLRGGHRLLCTPDHPIWTKKGYRQAGELEDGELVYMPLVESHNEFSTIGDNMWFLVGAWIGDGWNDKRSHVYIAIGDTDSGKKFKKIIENKLPEGHGLVHRKRYDYRISGRGNGKNSLNLKLKELGLWNIKCKDKFIPDEIFRQSRQNKILFLQGLFATDGWASGKDIGFASTSRELVRGLWRLLRSIDITGGVYYKKSQKEGVWNDQWYLLIGQSSNVIKFCDFVGIPSKESSVSKVREDAVRRLLSSQTRGVDNLFKSQNKIDKDRLRRWANGQRDQYFSVNEITPQGRAFVYDISVEGENNHNFICEGIKVKNCWMDEPPPRSKYSAMSRGLLLDCGKTLMTLTPLKEAWILDDIVLSGRKDIGVIDSLCVTENPQLLNDDIRTLQGFGFNEKAIREYFNLLLYDDAEKKIPVSDKGHRAERFLLDRIPVDKQEDIAKLRILKFIKDIDPDDVPPRVFGHFKSLVGRVLKEFNDSIHVIEPFKVPTDWVITPMIDFHLSKPQAVSYWAVNKQEIHYCIAEVWQNISADEIADDIVRRKLAGWRIEDAFIDPLSKGDTAYVKNMLGTDIKDSFSIIHDKLSHHGMTLHVATKDKDSGIKNIQSWLKGVNGLPICYIFNTCERHRFEAKRWVFDEDMKPAKEYDDMMENWYRYTLTGASYSNYDIKPLRDTTSNKYFGYAGLNSSWMAA